MKKPFLTLMILFLLFTLGASPVMPSIPAEHIAVILILDNSGSMQTSDPGELRFTGVRLFASLLDLNDSLGLILFSTRADVLTDGLVTLDSQTDKNNLLDSLQFREAHGYTDVKAALKQAEVMLQGANLDGRKVVIVLLTDGKPEIPNPYPQYERETLETACSLNVPILAIALTDAAQTPFLDQLATETNGQVFPADDSSDLLNAYLQVLGQIKDRTVIGGEKFQTEYSLKIDPALAPYINSVSFVIGKPEQAEVRLLGPDGREMSANAVNVANDARFVIVTVEHPVGGKYTFRAGGSGMLQAWAILRSRLRVEMVEPGRFHPLGRELPLVVRLLEETAEGRFIKIIGEVNFSARIMRPDGSEISLDRFYDDGTHGDAVANDGDYTRIYPNTDVEGEYLISIQGWKDAVPVQAQSRVSILRFPEFVVDAPKGTVQVRGEKIELRVHLEGGNPPMFDRGQVIAQVKSPSSQTAEIAMQGKGVYVGEFIPVEDGEYRVRFETRDVKYRGEEYFSALDHVFSVNIVPFAEVIVDEANVPSMCLVAPNEIILSMTVTSSGAETLRFSVPNGWSVSPETMNVRAGEQKVQVLLSTAEDLRPEFKGVDFLIEGGGRLEVRPDAIIRVQAEVPNVWTRCQAPIRMGGGILFLILIGAAVVQHVRKNALPLPVNGTLRYWAAGENPAQAVELDLTAFEKPSLLVGNGATCDVMIPDAGLDSEHVRLTAEKSPEGLEIYLEPIGEVRQGYHLQSARFLLRHGDTFRMGTHEFQFLSDRGE